MRKINKSQAPNELTIYAISNPDDTWDSFRRNKSKDAKKNKKIEFSQNKTIFVRTVKLNYVKIMFLSIIEELNTLTQNLVGW